MSSRKSVNWIIAVPFFVVVVAVAFVVWTQSSQANPATKTDVMSKPNKAPLSADQARTLILNQWPVLGP